MRQRSERPTVGLCAHVVPGLPSEFENFSDFLSDSGVPHIRVAHPLLPGPGTSVVVGRGIPFRGSSRRRIRNLILRSSADLFRTPRVKRGGIWIGFNPISLLAGGFLKRDVTRVLWCIDFVPRRGSRLQTFVYRWAERVAIRRSDVIIENNSVAAAARERSAGVWRSPHTKVHISPISVDLSRFPSAMDTSRDLVLGFLGSVNHRTGADRLVSIFHGVKVEFPEAKLVVIGGGQLLHVLRSQAQTSPWRESISILGFLESEDEVAAHVSNWTLGLAPFDDDRDAWTAYADPQKIRIYMAAGVIPILTDVPPIAREIDSKDLGVVIPASATDSEFSSAINELLCEQERVDRIRRTLFEVRESFGRPQLYAGVVKAIALASQ